MLVSHHFTQCEYNWFNRFKLLKFYFLTDEENRSASDSDECIIPGPVSKYVKQVSNAMPARDVLK